MTFKCFQLLALRLNLKDPRHEVQEGINCAARSDPIDGVVRQTRVSFEAHPSLLIYDNIICMLEQMNCAKISDDAEEESNDEVSDEDEVEEKKKIKIKRTVQTLRSLFVDDEEDILLDEEDSGDQVFEDE